MQPQGPFRGFLFLLCVLLTRGVAVALPGGQTTGQEVSLKEKKAAFQQALATLAKQYGVGFVIEGEPSPVVLENLKTVPTLTDEPLNKAVNRIAAAYDYTAEFSGKIFRLKKRYTYPSEVICITAEECIFAAREMARLTKQLKNYALFDKPGQQDAAIAGSVRNLSREQERLLQKQGFLKMSDLTFGQRASTWSLLSDSYFNGLVQATGYGPLLWNQFDHIRIRYDDKNRLGYGVRICGEGAEHFFFFGVPEVAHLPENQPIHPTTTLKLESNAVSFKDAVSQLQGHSKDSATFSVEDYLAAKPITLVGVEDIDPLAVLRAVADLYGLRVRYDEDKKQYLLTRQATTLPKGQEEAFFAIRNTLPAPILRAYRVAEKDALMQQWLTGNFVPSQEAYVEATERLEQHRMAIGGQNWRRLSGSVIAKMEEKKAKSIAFRELDPEGNARFGLVPLGSILELLSMHPIVPLYISRFDDLCLTYKTQPGENGWNEQQALGFYLFDKARNQPGMFIIGFGGDVGN